MELLVKISGRIINKQKLPDDKIEVPVGLYLSAAYLSKIDRGKSIELFNEVNRLTKSIFLKYHSILFTTAAEQEIDIIDMTPSFILNRDKNMWVDDCHPSLNGHKLIAEKCKGIK